MFPSFDIGVADLPAYFTLLMVGFTVAILAAHKEALRGGQIDGNTILDLGLLMLACGLIGSRVLHVLADGHFWTYVNLCVDPAAVPGLAVGDGLRCVNDAQCHRLALGDLCDAASGLCRQERDCLRVFKIWYGGYAYYGGLLLAVPVGIWFLHHRGQRVWQVADLVSWAISLGLAFGRTGCLLAGCCFGQVTDGPLGLAFPRFSPAWDRHVHDGLIAADAAASLPVHATQLYEAVFAALLALVLWRYYRRGPRFEGEVFFLFNAAYAVFRFAVELIRADDRGAWFGEAITTSQLISLPLLAWSMVAFARGRAWPVLGAAGVDQTAPAGTDPDPDVRATTDPAGDHEG